MLIRMTMATLRSITLFFSLSLVARQTGVTSSESASAALFSDGECLSHEALDVFRTSPGGYEVADGRDMNGTTCSSLCSDFDLPYAGVIYRQYCLCASDQDFASLESGTTVTRIESQECDVNPNIRFYGKKKEDSRSSSSLSRRVQAKITASTEKAFVDENISFDIAITEPATGKLDGLESQVDFDDGTPLTLWSDKKRVDHIFRIPGRFMVKIHVRQAKQPDNLVAAASTIVSIGQRMDETEVNFTCRSLIEPGDGSGCNVTIYGGQDVTVEADFGDSSPPFVFNTSGKLDSISLHSLCM
jgi:hypothetical protein